MRFQRRRGASKKPPDADYLSGVFQGKDLLLHGWWKIHKNKKTLVIQVIFATLIDDPHEIVQGGFRIGKDPVNFPSDQGRSITAVIDTKREGFRRCFHLSSK